MFEEDHDCSGVIQLNFLHTQMSMTRLPGNEQNTHLGRIWEDIKIQPEVTLLSYGHIVTDHLDR